MHFWRLDAIHGLLEGDDPWKPEYVKIFSMVVRAESEKIARLAATEEAASEISGFPDAWTNPKYSTCIEIPVEGHTEVILRHQQTAIQLTTRNNRLMGG